MGSNLISDNFKYNLILYKYVIIYWITYIITLMLGLFEIITLTWFILTMPFILMLIGHLPKYIRSKYDINKD